MQLTTRPVEISGKIVESFRDAWELQVELRPEQEFLVFEESYTGRVVSRTYAQTNKNATELALVLQENGVSKGTQILLYMGNTIEFVESMLAIAKLGAVAVPVDETARPFELNRIKSLCDARHIILDKTTVQNLGEISPDGVDHLYFADAFSADESGYLFGVSTSEVETLSVMRSVGVTVHEIYAEAAELNHLLIEKAELASVDISGSDLYEILFTSGTTAAPKGVMITHRNVLESGRFVEWELALTAADRYATSMVSTRVNFQLSAFAPVITAGATLVMFSCYSASRFWAQLRRHRATMAQGMALIIATLLKQDVDLRERDHQLRGIHYFLPLATAQKEEFENRFGVKLINNYGSTESLIGVITDPATGNEKWPSIGQIGPGYNAKIVDENGVELPAGEVGELLIQGIPGITLMAGYWNNPEATAAVLSADGWYRTGDFMYCEDGWFYFVDRRTDLIKRNGETVSSAEVEETIQKLPEVAEVAVVGVPDPIRGQEIKAVVVPQMGAELSAESLISFCEAHLASFKVPSLVEFVSELPRSAYGKVNKAALLQ
ncbi:MAG: AMP-binding protein [Arcanobacterium sp.]|nr:AMP-binding protein [Arcanobacterium sp.]